MKKSQKVMISEKRKKTYLVKKKYFVLQQFDP